MVSERDRILNVKDYIESFGIQVNIGKNKAKGNKGYFKVHNELYRIDVAKNLDEKSIISTLCHEFSHFIHYKYDKKLKSLDFIFDELNDNLQSELIEITIHSISKESIKPLFETKEKLKIEIKNISKTLSSKISDFKLTSGSNLLEKSIKKTQYKYLLKHDRVKVFGFFTNKIYSIENIKKGNELSEFEISYLILKSKQRMLKRINSKINKLNNYYNSQTELFARSIEFYINNNVKFKEKAPLLYEKISKIITQNKIPELTKLIQLATD